MLVITAIVALFLLVAARELVRQMLTATTYDNSLNIRHTVWPMEWKAFDIKTDLVDDLDAIFDYESNEDLVIL